MEEGMGLPVVKSGKGIQLSVVERRQNKSTKLFQTMTYLCV